MYSTTPTHGTLSGSAPNLTYIPNAGYIGPDAFTFRANDSTTNSNTATVSITVRGLAPVINSSVGYINGTPLTAHTSTAFKSTGSSTLVAFVSSHTPWNGLPQTVDWRFSSVLDDIVPDTAFKLFAKAREQSQIECLPLSVATRYPSYVSTERTRQLRVGEAVLGLILCSESGKRLGYFPAVEHLDQALLDRLDSLDVLLFDGTFWSDDELIMIQNGGQTARQMGHLPVSSAAGSLDLLSKLRCPRKIFVHINNTNPMLDVTGPEYRRVRESGWEMAEDGWHLEL